MLIEIQLFCILCIILIVCIVCWYVRNQSQLYLYLFGTVPRLILLNHHDEIPYEMGFPTSIISTWMDDTHVGQSHNSV